MNIKLIKGCEIFFRLCVILFSWLCLILRYSLVGFKILIDMLLNYAHQDTINMSKKKNQFFGTNSQKKSKSDNAEDSEVKLISIKKVKNKNAYANIIHKKSFGANNWKQFIQSNPECKLSKIDNRRENNKHNQAKNGSNFYPRPIIESNSKNDSVAPDVHSSMIDCKGPSSKNNLKVQISQRSNKKEKTPVENKNSKSSNHNIQRQLENVKKLASVQDSNNKGICLTKQIAMDCEMVGVEMGVNGNMLARVSLVNAHGDCVYDKYVKPTEPVVSYRTHVSGIRPNDLEKATDFKTVQKEVADILKDRILVGHALKNDLSVLFLTHPNRDRRDTSKFNKFREGKTPALKKLAKQYLGVTIQEGEHSSVQDALAAMQLYKMFRKDWESTIKFKIAKKHNVGGSKKSTPLSEHQGKKEANI